MKAHKNPKTKLWDIQFRYTDWNGTRRKTTKRSFDTKREAEAWLRDFLEKKQADCNMQFGNFIEIYYEDVSSRIREHTLVTKKYIIENKIRVAFGSKKVCDIKASDIRKWQNNLIAQGYAPTYLKTIHNQLSCLFNYGIRFYEFPENPCKKAGSMGKKDAEEVEIWLLVEFQKFVDSIMDKHVSYMAFMTLFYTGIRLGEMLALTRKDIDLENKIISIEKSMQRIKQKDLITPPKNESSIRKISIPNFLAEDFKCFFERIYDLKPQDRIFNITKGYLANEMTRGAKLSGVKRIKPHSLRHSHCAYLISLDFSPYQISKRLGHNDIQVTMNTYGHLYEEIQSDILNRLDKEARRNYNVLS